MDNNIQQRIDDYLDQVFGDYPDTGMIAELKTEIRHDLLERLADLTRQGVGDEVAYAQVISSMGDIESIIRELLERENAYDTADEPAGSGPTAATGQRFAEPDGPASSIPNGDAPGAEWRSDTDWMAGVAEAVAAGLDAARTQVAWALGQAEEAINRVEKAHPGVVFGAWAGREPGKSYTSSHFKGADFSGQQLGGSSFAASSMREAKFCGTMLAGSSFSGADLRGADFSQADLSNAKLNACSLRQANFERATLTGAGMTSSEMRLACFVGANLTGVRARFSDMRQARFADARMDGADFTGSDLRGAVFDHLRLTNVKFNMANLAEACFRGSVLRGVTFNHLSRGTVTRIIFEDTVVDQATYTSLCSTGHTPQGVRVEN